MSPELKLRPSGWDRWSECPGSVEAEAPYPDTSSTFADEGSVAHLVGECVLKEHRATAADYIGHIFPEYPDQGVTDEMAGHVQQYVDYVRALGGALFIEQQISIPWIQGTGTTDAGVLVDDVLHVVDYKHGKGLRVDVENNGQLKIYAAGLLALLGPMFDTIETVVLTIYQPRMNNVQSCDIPAADLRAWAEGELKARAAAAMTPGAPRVPGTEQCRWCRAKGDCGELAAHAMDTIGARAAPAGIPPAELSDILSQASLIRDWLDALAGRAYTLAETGELPGWKLVSGRKGSRCWSDPDAATKKLRRKFKIDQVQPRTLISVAQAERLIGKPAFAPWRDLVSQTEGKPTLAPESDPRAPVETVTEGFSPVETA